MRCFYNIKKTCNFYVSTIHLTTMLIPYIHKQLELKKDVITFFQYNLEGNVNELLSKIILKDEEKEKIKKINWNSSILYKYSNIEKKSKDLLKNNNETIILVMGDEKRIDFVGESLIKFFEKNFKKIENKKITIINCFEVSEFNNNILDILKEHKYILNTSGEYSVEEYFNINENINVCID